MNFNDSCTSARATPGNEPRNLLPGIGRSVQPVGAVPGSGRP
jgi:hypothetical protein